MTNTQQTANANTNRRRLLAGIPAAERQLELAGISTAVLEGGDGPPIVLLHGPGEFAAKWMHVLPDLATGHRVVAPDLPGHGATEVPDGALDAGRVMAWLDELIELTCPAPPTLVGHLLGGSIAARYAVAHGDRLDRLVLVDSFGLGPFRPAPSFALALMLHLARPSERTFDRLWRRCALDLNGLRARMGEGWEPFAAYALDRAQRPGVRSAIHSLMDEVGVTPIPLEQLERITVPTSLIWGRHNLGIRVRVAEAAAKAYGWPLEVIEGAGDDAALEQPEAFVRALRTAMSG